MSKNNENNLVPKLRFPEFQNIEGWKEKKLGEIGEFIGGGTPDTSVEEYWDGEIQWFTPTEIKERNIKRSIRTITQKGLQNSSAKLLPKGALLITTRATIGDVGIAIEECSTNQGFQSLVVNNAESNLYWYYWITHNKNELKRRSSGSTFPEIGKNEIIKITAYSPKKNEQQKIAECLSSLDDVITAEGQRLDILRDHKKGLLQNLLPQAGETMPKMRLKEFEDSGAWGKDVLENLIDLLSGFAFSSDYFSGEGMKLLTPKNFTKEGYANFNEVNTKYTTESVDQKYICKGGDLLLLLTDLTPSCELLGKPILLKKEDGQPLLNQRIVKVILKTKVKIEFLHYFFSTDLFHKRIKDTATGSTVRHSSNSIILGTELYFPPLKEQEKIANTLSSIDDMIIAQDQKLKTLQLHKKGLLQGLFPNLNEVKA